MKRTLLGFLLVVLVAGLVGVNHSHSTVQAQETVEIDFYFPEATANNAQAVFEEYAVKFNELHPEIKVNIVYQGAYTDNRNIILTQVAAGEGPDVAVMLTTDLFSFLDEGYIIPVQDFVDSMDDPEAFINDFFPAFLTNSLDEEGVIWSIPFQRSTPVLYYNADALAEAGIEAAPRNREELIAAAQALTTEERYGLWLPSEGFPIWLFSAAPIANGQNLVEEDPCTVYFDTPEVADGLDAWLKMSSEYGVMPEGILSWGDTPGLFTSGGTAMAMHTTGSLTRILNESSFEVGVGFIPFGTSEEGYGVPTGGGNLYLFANSTPEEQQAAWLWAEFLASPKIQADWGSRTGYVAARQSAWELDPLAALVAEKPQYAVARDQLAYAQKEFSSYATIDIQGIINTALSNIISGQEADVAAALTTAQEQIDGILAEYCE